MRCGEPACSYPLSFRHSIELRIFRSLYQFIRLKRTQKPLCNNLRQGLFLQRSKIMIFVSITCAWVQLRARKMGICKCSGYYGCIGIFICFLSSKSRATLQNVIALFERKTTFLCKFFRNQKDIRLTLIVRYQVIKTIVLFMKYILFSDVID